MFHFLFGSEVPPQNQDDLDGDADDENIPNDFGRLVVKLELNAERQKQRPRVFNVPIYDMFLY